MNQGDVLWLEPNVLAAHMTTECTDREARWTILRPHRFVCVMPGIWCPIFSRPRFDRIRIPNRVKHADGSLRSVKWMVANQFASPYNLWIVTPRAIEEARKPLARWGYGERIEPMPKELVNAAEAYLEQWR